ncbi:DUF5681 domain-containing protein [Methylobacterium sp. WL18]|uniref:DUF5681 domain-containing protein n=1 Tax=Methylobacterium sp. WL18 TaxID=2603897 RepID=UPI00164F2CB0|nr:DUF5681 domain-containing protein [Methylobacterium sp. WL18]
MTYDDDDEQPAELGQANSTPKPPEDGERVGYKCPPKRTRFVKGKSGNPEGRPKGSLNRSTMQAMVEELWFEKTMKIVDGGRERQVPRLLGLMIKQGDIALKGDRKAIKDCFDLIFRMIGDAPIARGDDETATEDDAILRTHHSEAHHAPEPDTDELCEDEGGGRD